MFYALIWFGVLFCLALWSLTAWAFHAVAAWTAANAGVLSGGSGALRDLPLPDWLAAWMPPELAAAWPAVLGAIAPAVEALLGLVPALGSVLTVAVWVGWAIGSALLLMMGLAGTALVAVLRRRNARQAVAGRGTAAVRPL